MDRVSSANESVVILLQGGRYQIWYNEVRRTKRMSKMCDVTSRVCYFKLIITIEKKKTCDKLRLLFLKFMYICRKKINMCVSIDGAKLIPRTICACE